MSLRPSLRLLPTPEPRPDLLDLLHDFDRESRPLGRPTPLASHPAAQRRANQEVPQDTTPADRIPPGAA